MQDKNAAFSQISPMFFYLSHCITIMQALVSVDFASIRDEK